MKRAGWTISILAAALALCASAAADTWTGPDLERRPDRIGQGDLDFALSEMCFPYLLQNADIAVIAERVGVIAAAPQEWAVGARAFYAGQADVVVALRETETGRECIVRVNDGNEERYSETLTQRLAQWPTPLTRAAEQIAPNQYVSRELLCGPADGPQDTALISIGGRNGMPSAMVTLARSQTRERRCNGGSAPAPPAPAAAVTLDQFAAVVTACQAMIAGTPVDEAAQVAGLQLGPAVALAETTWRTPGASVAEFFGADAQIRFTPRGTAPVVIVSADGARCNIAAVGRDGFADRLGVVLDLYSGAWTRTGENQFRSAAGETVRYLTATRENGAVAMVVYITRGGG